MPEKTEEKTVKMPRLSSGYTRVVGNVKLDVINVKQNPGNLPKKANKKWAVLATKNGRSRVIGATDKKYPAIDILLAEEKVLKAAAAKKDE
jgi:hypothetical protein